MVNNRLLALDSWYLLPLFVGIILSTASCSNNPPVIEQTVASHLVHFDSATQSTQQAFSVFSAVQDKDGFQDIDNMYVLDDSSQLLWHLTGNDLQSFDNQSRHWIGNKHLIAAPGETIPVGKLRVIIYDRAGNKAQSETGLPLLDANIQSLIPRAQRQNNNLNIFPSAAWDKMDRELIVQDWSGSELSRFRISGSEVKLDSILNGKKAGDLKFMINDHYYNGSLLISSGPW